MGQETGSMLFGAGLAKEIGEATDIACQQVMREIHQQYLQRKSGKPFKFNVAVKVAPSSDGLLVTAEAKIGIPAVKSEQVDRMFPKEKK